ncbi:MAG: Rrf2 family transcriptional regulator [Ginsengibacter sp.]
MFSKTTEYALRATIYIAQKGTIDHKLGIEEIADAIGSPQSFTAKILQMIAKNDRVVISVKGPHGGFYITNKSKKLPVRAILEAVDDAAVLNKCILGLHQCSEKNPCPMHADYKNVRSQLIRLFEDKTIGYLADKMKHDNIFINNSR